jgi:hypothetical protein
VLAGLHRRIDKTPEVEVTALEDPLALQAALGTVTAGDQLAGGAA